MPSIATVIISVSLVTSLGCDTEDPADDLSVDARDDTQPQSSPTVEFLVDGQHRPEQVVAAVAADPDTTLYFSKSEPNADGRFAIDVTIVGRDGGFDYGGLLESEQATPLELYIALTDEPAPEALQLAHDWQVEEFRPEDTELRIIPAPQNSFDDTLVNGKSTFTCLSWSNFQSYMAGRFLGAPGRVEVVDSAVDAATIYNPHPSYWYPNSHVDMVACNFESSSDPQYNDTIDAELCHVRGLGGALTTNCGHMVLDDGWYLRRIYGPIFEYRQYKINVDPLSASQLQSFSGIVKRDG